MAVHTMTKVGTMQSAERRSLTAQILPHTRARRWPRGEHRRMVVRSLMLADRSLMQVVRSLMRMVRDLV